MGKGPICSHVCLSVPVISFSLDLPSQPWCAWRGQLSHPGAGICVLLAHPGAGTGWFDPDVSHMIQGTPAGFAPVVIYGAVSVELL